MVGVPVTVLNLKACKDEKVVPVKVLAVPTSVGFFTIPTCANFVSVGKSFVESSNLAYINTLSVPNSV